MKVNSDYMFLCGVMWCRFGQKEAGKELLRAATSMDPDMRALARAMLATGALRLRDLEGQAHRNTGTIPGGS
jgi:prophage DNA circulation protein